MDIKDEKERYRLKEHYIQEWFSFIKANPDYPQREHYGHGVNSGIEYRRAKDAWNERHTDYSKFLGKRFTYLMELGANDLSGLYSTFYYEKLKKGLGLLNV